MSCMSTRKNRPDQSGWTFRDSSQIIPFDGTPFKQVSVKSTMPNELIKCLGCGHKEETGADGSDCPDCGDMMVATDD
jgi:hypothetical protein